MSDDSNDGFGAGDTDETVTGDSMTESGNPETSADYNLSMKEQERLRLQNQIEEFLAGGGKIDEIEANITADPPQKPSSNYGSRPI